MGNQTVYSQGLFIQANKIPKPNLTIDVKKFDIENVFGKIDIPTARAQKGDDTIFEDLKTSYVTRVQHYQNQKQHLKIIYKKHQRNDQHEKCQKSILVQIDLNNKKLDHSIVNSGNLHLPATHKIPERKTKTQVSISQAINRVDLQKYMTRNDSPIKQENKTPDQSQILIFQSRLQNKYFKISK